MIILYRILITYSGISAAFEHVKRKKKGPIVKQVFEDSCLGSEIITCLHEGVL